MEAMDLIGIDPGIWLRRRVLVTGHTGFKGSWLVLWLLELGAEVYGYSLEAEPVIPPHSSLFQSLNLKKRLGFRHFVGDINDSSALQEAVSIAQPEVVIHLAAQSLVRRSYLDPVTTWGTNVQGSLNLLQSLRQLQHSCAVVLVTTDKIYANREWEWGYREDDRLGGHDPYSASKAAMELMAQSWRASFCGNNSHQTPFLHIATARSGNVIGGGDWSDDRIIPDAIRALISGEPISVRNPLATRPWQHVLEPLAGYLLLAQQLISVPSMHTTAYNFGPDSASNRTVQDLVEQILLHWPSFASWSNASDSGAPHEAGLLHLVADRAKQHLGWRPIWDFATTVEKTVNWYSNVLNGNSSFDCCMSDLRSYIVSAEYKS